MTILRQLLNYRRKIRAKDGVKIQGCQMSLLYFYERQEKKVEKPPKKSKKQLTGNLSKLNKNALFCDITLIMVLQIKKHKFMQEIIFYDSKNVPYMTWYNFSYNQQNGTLLFNVQFEYSIFNISECYKTNITQIINFEK